PRLVAWPAWGALCAGVAVPKLRGPGTNRPANHRKWMRSCEAALGAFRRLGPAGNPRRGVARCVQRSGGAKLLIRFCPVSSLGSEGRRNLRLDVPAAGGDGFRHLALVPRHRPASMAVANEKKLGIGPAVTAS